VRDSLAVAGQGVFGLGRGKFGYFSFVDFFGFFDSEPWKLACRPRRKRASKARARASGEWQDEGLNRWIAGGD
jgi:hypothetical protein